MESHKELPRMVAQEDFLQEHRQQDLFPVRFDAYSAPLTPKSFPFQTTNHHSLPRERLLRGDSTAQHPPPPIAHGCLLIPVFFAAWWYYTRNAFSRIRGLVRNKPESEEDNDTFYDKFHRFHPETAYAEWCVV